MCARDACNHARMPFSMPFSMLPKMSSEVGVMRDEERVEEEEETREEQNKEEKKKEEEKNDDDDDDDDDVGDDVNNNDDDDDEGDDDYDVGDDDDDDDDEGDDDDDDDGDDNNVGKKLKKSKRKSATKIAGRRRKIRPSPGGKTCCFVGRVDYDCHKGRSDVKADRKLPEAEKHNFAATDRCCQTCSNHFKINKVTCCFVGRVDYDCHKGRSDVRADHKVPEAEKHNFAETAMCCRTCSNHFKFNKVTCCFVGHVDYDCHKGRSDLQAIFRVPEAEKHNFAATDRCCQTCSTHFKFNKVTCCFAGHVNYACHKGGSDVRATRFVPEAEKDNFPATARCCQTCSNLFREKLFFLKNIVCNICEVLGYPEDGPDSTPGGWRRLQTDDGITCFLCSQCWSRETRKRKRRQQGVPERRKGRKGNGDW